VTVDEELDKLEDDLRRLRIEYEVYFNGGVDRPPRDRVFRVEIVIKRYTSDQSKLNFSQRFKLNTLAQKYAVQNALWKRRLIQKEEGRGSFGLQKRELKRLTDEETVRVVCSNPESEPDKVEEILNAIVSAQRKVGQKVENVNPARFRKYLCEKTSQVKESLGCARVQFSVSIEKGKVKFKATRA
jgi:hypothetical protein